jgi:hypothetical protein
MDAGALAGTQTHTVHDHQPARHIEFLIQHACCLMSHSGSPAAAELLRPCMSHTMAGAVAAAVTTTLVFGNLLWPAARQKSVSCKSKPVAAPSGVGNSSGSTSSRLVEKQAQHQMARLQALTCRMKDTALKICAEQSGPAARDQVSHRCHRQCLSCCRMPTRAGYCSLSMASTSS